MVILVIMRGYFKNFQEAWHYVIGSFLKKERIFELEKDVYVFEMKDPAVLDKKVCPL